MNDKKIDYEEIAKLVSFLEEKHLTEFELEVEGFKIKISRALSQEESVAKVSAPPPGAPPEQDQPASQAALTTAESPEKFHYITSPMVGTFYRAPNPASPSFIEIGEEVKKSQTLCIIEAMKLMNEIESDVDGIVAEIYVENGKPVEFGQRLFAIQPVAA
ncbi:MAG: acetyl-CoA carboxylase, biotin carboxyl carrier protein [Candidatus Aminicenantes bacterium RBG_13_59_9]|jgi:acetyl-CoA carboxylase biotin carboxyl carrier protein|nr:MAG: acetyl-CoA carboxylase, biotin carboxyl carrier protein [Candidatus Aminicenantes bacterium RBG_13_59_9]